MIKHIGVYGRCIFRGRKALKMPILRRFSVQRLHCRDWFKETSDFVGDFLAVATGEKSIYIKREKREFIGVHAGLTEDEMTVPFIAFETIIGRNENDICYVPRTYESCGEK